VIEYSKLTPAETGDTPECMDRAVSNPPEDFPPSPDPELWPFGFGTRLLEYIGSLPSAFNMLARVPVIDRCG